MAGNSERSGFPSAFAPFDTISPTSTVCHGETRVKLTCRNARGKVNDDFYIKASNEFHSG